MNKPRGELEEIWNQVPPDYYQRGVDHNLLQRRWHHGKLRHITGMIDNDPRTILEVGCASGWLLSQIAERYPRARCFGIDPYARAIAFGTRSYAHLSLVRGDGHALPFAAGSFDVVICAEVLEHVVSPHVVLGEIRRVLEPGGTAVIEMDSGNVLFRAVWYWWTHMRRGVWRDAHLHVFNTRTLRETIARNGLAITAARTFNCSMAVVFKVHRDSHGG